MNKSGRSVGSALYGIVIALLALTAFLYFGVYFLIIFIPAVAYFMWIIYNRIKVLEKRLAEPKRPLSENA